MPLPSLDTTTGQNWKGHLYLAGTAIFAMPDTHERTALAVLWLLCMAWISYRTDGSGLKPHEGQALRDDLSPADEDIRAAIERGRRP